MYCLSLFTLLIINLFKFVLSDVVVLWFTMTCSPVIVLDQVKHVISITVLVCILFVSQCTVFYVVL